MKTFITDIIPKIQRFSQRLDHLTKLTNQNWVSLGDITQTKRVFIFRTNNQLLIAENGIVEKGSWEYLENQSLLLETPQHCYLLKHGFFDENVIALKLDSSNGYAFFINETKYHSELNNINDILRFLEQKYIKNNGNSNNPDSTIKQHTDDTQFEYEIIRERRRYDLVWGNYTQYDIEFSDGQTGEVYRGGNSMKFFFLNRGYERKYFKIFEEAVNGLYLYLRQNHR